MKQGGYWFNRLRDECQSMSPYIRFVRVKLGFYRIYYKSAYIHEVYKEMPEVGYDMDDLDPRFENQKYYEEFEDRAELTRKIKNYVEGYWDSFNRIQRRLYMMLHDKEFNTNATKAYQQHYVK